ncbi:MAG: GDSL-type esterase/lipase family protein [Pseudomonadota bacterium]
MADQAGASEDEIVPVTVLPFGSGGGSLGGSFVVAPATVDLPTVGPDDWVHWARQDAADLDRRAGVQAQISDYTTIGSGSPSRYASSKTDYGWNGGTPTTSESGTDTGLRVFNAALGFSLSTPADATARTLRLYVGAKQATGRITATLSDNSAPPVTIDVVAGAKRAFVVTLNFTAASAGQSLDIDYVLQSEADPNAAWISLESAALTGAAPPANLPPEIDPVADQTITAGETLQFTVTASDPDMGPAALTFTATSTLPGDPDVLTDNGDGTASVEWESPPDAAGGSPYSIDVSVFDGDASDTETIVVDVVPDGSSGVGALSIQEDEANPEVNLTALGPSDWVHWGLDSPTAVNRKANVTAQISDYAVLGGATPSAGNAATGYNWSDGAPTGSASDEDRGVRVFGVDKGFSFTVDAGPLERVLRVFITVAHATAQLSATLSDDSAPPVSATLVRDGNSDGYVVALSYSAPNPGTTLTVELVMTGTFSGGTSLVGLDAAALIAVAPLALPFIDDFSGNAADWAVVNDGETNGDWSANGGEYGQTRFMGYNGASMRGAAHVGTYAYLPAGMQLGDYKLRVLTRADATSALDVGVMARVNPLTDSYYRVSFSGANSFGRLEVSDGGVFATLSKDTRGLLPGDMLDIELVVSGPIVTVAVNGIKRFAGFDATLTTGSAGLYCRDLCAFLDAELSSPPTATELWIASPAAFSVVPDLTFTASAVVLNPPTGASVEFQVAGQDCAAASETQPGLFEAECSVVASGEYDVTATLFDGDDAQLQQDTRAAVGVGDNFAMLGDSITAGLDDRTANDAISADGRIVGVQGVQAILSDRLSGAQPTVFHNGGVPGDTSDQMVSERLAGFLQRHGDANRLLLLAGVNDAGGTLITASGTGLNPGDQGYDGSFKDNIQTIADAAIAAGQTVYVAKAPPRFGDSGLAAPHPLPRTHPQNELHIAAYNEVIATELNGTQPGPDFFDFFLGPENRFYLYQTNLHPNALGYHAMAVLWDNAIGGGTEMPFFVTDLCLRESAGAACTQPLPYKQNLLEPGDRLYAEDAESVLRLDGLFDTSSGVPAPLPEGRWLQTRSGDRTLANADYLSFTVPEAATVYVAVDRAVTAPPAWLAAYAPTQLELRTDGTEVMDLFVQNGVVGPVTLGGLDSANSGAGRNYLVIVVRE